MEKRLSEWSASAKSQAARWASGVLPRNWHTALQIATTEFKPAPVPYFFSPDVQQISPALNDDLLELYGRAGQILKNRFAFFNSPEIFEHGINWEPSQSPVWRAELHACDYVLDLACTFRISGEEMYARHLRYVIAHWIACNPPGRGIGWQAHVVARRLRNWMLAADFARADWERDEEFSSLVAKSLALQLVSLLNQLDQLPSVAANLDASRALLCASRFFLGSKAREAHGWGFELLTRALDIARRQPSPQVRLATAQAWMEWNLLSTPDGDSDSLLKELTGALEELEALLTAGGNLTLFGSGARLAPDELADLAALAAVKLESAAWKSLAGKFGILPYFYLGESGKARFERLPEIPWVPRNRVPMGADIPRLVGSQNSVLTISARLPTAEPDHLDFCSYELSMNGVGVVVDSGGYSPEERTYFPGARAHNVLLVDGQEPRWRNAEGPANVTCDQDGAWLRISDPGFAFLGVQHERAWRRLENEAWLILDRLAGARIRCCTSLMHFYPTLEISLAEGRFLARSRACCFAVTPLGPAKPRGWVAGGEHPQFPGWYSPEYGVKFPTAVLALEWSRIELPWVGGVLITSGAEPPPHQIEITPSEGTVRFAFGGKTYCLQMS